MSVQDVTYKENSATEAQLESHFISCNDQYQVPLLSRVNPKEYSKKIFKKGTTFEAWRNGHLIGLVAAYLTDLKSSDGYITDVSVAKECTGQGIAQSLMQNCIEKSKKLGLEAIELEVHSASVAAVKLYRTLGFIEVSVHEDISKMRLVF